MKHQIILTGKDITSVYHGIKEFGPDVIHLLYTEETEELIEQLFPMLPVQIEKKCYLVKPYDAESIIETCRSIHQAYNGEFSYNLSEGTKLMAFAAFQVAREKEAEAFYLTQQGEIIELSGFKKNQLRTFLSNEEIIQLSGNKIIGYHEAASLLDENIRMAHQINQFIEQHKKEHTRLQRYYSLYCKRKIELLPAAYQFPDGLSFKQRNGRLLIAQNDQLLMKLGFRDACFLYFEGRWWETLVAEQVNLWSQQQADPPQAWQSVRFQLTEHGEKGVKNEVDVLVNSQQELIFIECKSGQVTQNDIYKIDAVRETYGGDISHAVLASYYPVDHDILEKCADLQINVFAPSYFAERRNYVEKLPEWLDELNKQILL